jgi:hypothetical protein
MYRLDETGTNAGMQLNRRVDFFVILGEVSLRK